MASKRAAEAAQLYEYGLTPAEVAKRMGISESAARGMASKGRKQAGKQAKIIADEFYYPSARDINDTDQWADYLNHMTRRDKMLKIQFWPDMHMMDVSWQALGLALQMRRDFKPDVDLFLGDEFDFSTLSVHWGRSEHTRRVDAFREVRPSWYGLQDILSNEKHKSKKAMLGGNHTRKRVEDYVNEKAPEFADTIIEGFIDLTRADNRVWWMGWQDEMWVGNFMIEHGERVGENASKNSLKDIGFASPRVGGHTHAPSEAWNSYYGKSTNILRPNRHIVQSVTLPCLCNLIPAYAKHKQKSRWLNGLGFAYVNLSGLDVHMHKAIFHTRDNGEMVGAFGSEEYRQKEVNELEKVA